MIVTFNAPFDLSRLATQATEGDKGDWSLALAAMWKNPKTGRTIPNPKRPRLTVQALNSKMAFIKLGSVLHKEEWPRDAHFLDLRTFGWALRNESFTLERACDEFDVEGTKDHKLTGTITSEEIDYCREDVAASHRLLNAMMVEFDQNPIDLRPNRAYSPAAIAKSYLDAMGIKKPKLHFRVSNKILGIAGPR